MTFSKKMWLVVIGGVAAGLMKLWPLPLDPQVLNSLKIYSKYVVGGDAEISSLLGSVDIACAVGPYDSYLDSRFSKTLTDKQMLAAEFALKKQNETSFGDNQFFLVGLRGEKVVSVYVSYFFSNSSTLEKNPANALNCVGGDGLVSPERSAGVVAIKLKKGRKNGT